MGIGFRLKRNEYRAALLEKAEEGKFSLGTRRIHLGGSPTTKRQERDMAGGGGNSLHHPTSSIREEKRTPRQGH